MIPQPFPIARFRRYPLCHQVTIMVLKADFAIKSLGVNIFALNFKMQRANLKFAACFFRKQ